MQSSNTQLSSRSPDPLSPSLSLQNSQSPTRSSSSSSHSQTPLSLRPAFASIPRDASPFSQATKPSTPTASAMPAHHVMQSTPPLTPPSSLSPTSSIASTVSLGSTLSLSAPQFQTSILDAPIDIHTLTISDSANSMTHNVSEPLPKARTPTGPVQHSPGNMLDLSMGNAMLTEGPTPTQESFGLMHSTTGVPSSTMLSSASSQSMASMTTSTTTSDLDSTYAADLDTERTPNVYINGLPPNFPEDHLYAMTKDFGEVISVRTFTRHVSDKPSGYGFVLFGSVDAAGRCIEALRKLRHLHPSFSKRVHKIPGTIYGSVPSATSDSGISLSSLSDSGSADTPTNTFKTRMERLQDRSSTNLYMEGLPLDIDEPTLSALVSPYKILSSRFFQTRLSNPPRIIAFVRLESRTAAEEVIERLHGRMVRGWRDPGCRISVRFADNSEQRELRRVERMSRDGENSPARITIAQAALLNLKGGSLQGTSPRMTGSAFGGLSPTFNTNMALINDGVYGSQLQGYGQELVNPVLQSLGVDRLGSQYDGLNAQAAESQLQTYGTRPKAAVRTHDGFTSYERLLLQAHLQRQQEELAAASAELDSLRVQTSTGLGSNAALTLGGPPLSISSGRRNPELMTAVSEDEFHAGAAHRQQLPFADSRSAAVEIKVPPSRQALDLPDAKANFTRQRNQTHAEARAQANANVNQSHPVHARSTTLPSQYTTRDRSSGGTFLNSTTSEGNTLRNMNVKSSFDSKKNITYPSNNRNLSGNNVNTNTITNSNNNDSKHLISNNDLDHTQRDIAPPYIAQQTSTAVPSNTKNGHTRIDTSLTGLLTASRTPATSTRTPATLSPATPYSAFAETYDGPAPSVVVPGAIAVGESNVQKEVGLGIGGGAGKDINVA
ncbi:hypothetical protein QCA50_013801 [Cerrena zonata]|uniref:RRM domain-containing protein n=1 Tax=Cerrena zonata TaxID=2478898 RepID=A0AAW0FQ05_9APHY